MSKRFFISHASADKPFALALKEHLDDDAWIDLHEIDIGDILVEQISAGIEGATDFVLLWSSASAASSWVRFEFNMAFIHWLEDKAITLRIICLDDTRVPLHMRPFLQARDIRTPAGVAAALGGPSVSVTPRRTFFNRNSEVDHVEAALYDSRTIACVIAGMPGVGKRTLAREALGRITSGTGTVRKVPVSAGIAEPELDLLVSSLAEVTPAPETASVSEVADHLSSVLRGFADAGGVWVFEDAEHWLNDDGSLGRVITRILETLTNGGNQASRLVVFTSRRTPRLDAWTSSVRVVHLRGLAPQFAVPLLKARGAQGPDDALAKVATDLDGHPLALEVVAPRLPIAAADLLEQRFAIASDLVDPASVSSTTWRVMELLSVADGPVRSQDIASILELQDDQFQNSIIEATEYALVEYDDTQSLILHPLLRDYFLRSFRKSSDYVQQTTRLADLLKDRFSGLTPDDSIYVAALLSAVKVLGLSGRFQEARSLRQGLIGTLLQTATELYQEKRYPEALAYIEEALTGDREVDLQVLELKAKTLAYLGRTNEARDLADELVAENPSSPSVMRTRGRVEFIDRDWSSAINYFRRAIPLRRNPAQLWADIAQCHVRMRDWHHAAAAAKTAIDLGGDTPWALALYSQALEQTGDLPKAEEMMSRAVSREPNNPAYRHRLGMIAQLRGNRAEAIEQFRTSVRIDPTFVESWLSLASALADSGDYEGANGALERASAHHGAPRAIVDNLRAKIQLGVGNLTGAAASIEAALRSRRDAQNLSLAVRITVARAEAGLLSIGQAAAQVRTLSQELDTLGGLAWVLELSQSYPKYFDA